MIRKTVVLLLILAAGICVYQGSSPYIEARMEQEHLKQAAFPGNEGNLSEEEGRKGNGPTREETVLYTSPIDFEVLKSINPDIVGWIQIPGTAIDYPICWRAGDNEYYMKHSAIPLLQRSIWSFSMAIICAMGRCLKISSGIRMPIF